MIEWNVTTWQQIEIKYMVFENKISESLDKFDPKARTGTWKKKMSVIKELQINLKPLVMVKSCSSAIAQGK